MVQIEPQSPSVEVLAQGSSRATRAGIRRAPRSPGCYLFRDAEDNVLYVGKSIALRHRLASYFSKTVERKTRAMVGHACVVEWQTVGSEVEALILESQLIKRYLPPYNVLGRDYPHYLFLRLNDGGGYPYLEITTGVPADGATYFGPFWGRRSAEQTLEFVNRLFSLRQCSGALPSPEQGRACFYAQVHRCSAPCLNAAAQGEYAATIRSASDLLRGDVVQLVKRLEAERDEAAEQLRFERAAGLHQIVLALQTLQRKRGHLRSAANTVNFLMVVRDGNKPGAQVLAFSAARLRAQMTIEDVTTTEWRSGLERFVLEHYPTRRQLSIDLGELDQMHVVAEWLARQDRCVSYVPLPDRALRAADASAAADTVARIVQDTPGPAPSRQRRTPVSRGSAPIAAGPGQRIPLPVLAIS